MTIDRGRPRARVLLALPIAAGLAVAGARSQTPIALPPLPPGYAGPAAASSVPPPRLAGHGHGHEPGPIKRAAHHVGFTIKDKMIGYPEYFAQPPLGASVRQNMAAQVAQARLHSYTLYRSDFLAGTDQLTEFGAAKLARMTRTLDCWSGPLMVEADPRRPGLAEMRRDSVAATLQKSGLPVDPNRLVVGMSPYSGLRGDIAGGATYYIYGYDRIMIDRSYAAPSPDNFGLPPSYSAQEIGDRVNGGGQ